MKAVCYSRYGNPDVLHLEDVSTPEPGPGEILVKVRAAEATKSDCELRSFQVCGEVVLAAAPPRDRRAPATPPHPGGLLRW